ncbi:peptidase S41 [Myroides sp. M-43]|uniref:S41 family peptidase n=1 Tax=Myroides oncorhynchi TaxID=2893756 RepID=UPI001E4E4C02|nr:S41 family peptidase [Myroides oncorhynchi]MCC9043658.1 peptidase S41 [Myroides oncorhynchi]
MNSRILILFLIVFSQLTVLGQKKIKDLTKENYLEDFDFIVKVIKQQHPNAFRFITENDFDAKVKKSRLVLEKQPSLENFILSNPLALINDTHSSITPDNVLFDEFTKQSDFFPLTTSVYNNKVFINQYTLDIPIGAEVIKVNNLDVIDILNRIPNGVDGNIQASSQKDFSLYVSLIFPKTKEFVIEYKQNSGDKNSKKVVLKSVNFSQYNYNAQKSILPLNTLAFNNGIYGYQLDKQTYILTITSFNMSEEYAYFILNNIFATIKENNIKNLVLDIRDNSGGMLSNIPLFYSFISTQKEFKNIYKYATRVPKINVRENLLDENNKLANTTDIIAFDNFMKQRFDFNQQDQFYYGNNRLDEYYVENYPQDRNAFTGKVSLLINNNTISAAAYFAYLFQLNKRGDIVGQETRSCSNFTTAAWFLNYKLPNTESILSLPRSKIFFNTVANKENTCRGVIPNQTIESAQYQKGLQSIKDSEMNLALELLNK